MEPVERCRHDIDELLHKRADGRLSAAEAAALERQTAACASCRERAFLLDWAGDRMSRLPLAATNELADEVMRRVRRHEPSRPLGSALASRWLPAAAALAAGVGAIVFFHDTKPPETFPRVRVELQLEGASARSVSVAGDWSGWDAVEMKKGADGVFRVQLSLPRGRYQYAFLVDERTWVADPRAATSLDSGYGGTDSVLDLTL